MLPEWFLESRQDARVSHTMRDENSKGGKFHHIHAYTYSLGNMQSEVTSFSISGKAVELLFGYEPQAWETRP